MLTTLRNRPQRMKKKKCLKLFHITYIKISETVTSAHRLVLEISQPQVP